MGKVENFKKLKAELQNEIKTKLQTLIAQIIPGGTILVDVSEDIDIFTFDILMEKQISKTTLGVTENVLIYDTKDPDNIVFKGSTRISVYKAREDGHYGRENLYSIAATNAEIDLRTLYSLRNRLKNFAQENELLDAPSITVEDDLTVDNDNVIIKDIK